MSDTPTPEGTPPSTPPTMAAPLDELRATVAAAAGLPDGLAARLQGSNLTEMMTDAKTLAGLMPKAAPASSPAPPAPAAETSASIAGLSDAQIAALDAAGLGVTPSGHRREQPDFGSVDAIRELARRNPREFNRKLEAGEIKLSQLTR